MNRKILIIIAIGAVVSALVSYFVFFSGDGGRESGDLNNREVGVDDNIETKVVEESKNGVVRGGVVYTDEEGFEPHMLVILKKSSERAAFRIANESDVKMTISQLSPSDESGVFPLVLDSGDSEEVELDGTGTFYFRYEERPERTFSVYVEIKE